MSNMEAKTEEDDVPGACVPLLRPPERARGDRDERSKVPFE